MKICLKYDVKKTECEPVRVLIESRLPRFIRPPCEITASLQIDVCEQYYLLSLNTMGSLVIICQRCLGDFSYDYRHQNQLAICSSEEVAERLIGDYDVIVSATSEIDLVDILTDDLHLFCPEKHEDVDFCDNLVKQYVR